MAYHSKLLGSVKHLPGHVGVPVGFLGTNCSYYGIGHLIVQILLDNLLHAQVSYYK